MSSLLEARSVTYAYPHAASDSSRAALSDVSLTIEPGSLVALIGANGSGKSTLIRIFAGLLGADSGEILLEGRRIGDWDPRLRARKIAYVPQATPMVFPFRALEVVLS